MLKLFRYLKKAYFPVLCIIALLVIQAICELSLPTYTSNIVNVGIQQGGIEDAVPEVMREETFQGLSAVMEQDDAKEMKDAYELYSKKQVQDSDYKSYKDGRLYVRKNLSSDEREKLDTMMSKAMLTLSSQMAQQMQANPQASANLSKSQKEMLQEMQHMDIDEMPDSIISQAAITFVKSEYQAVGIDLDDVQTKYLLKTGGIMIGIAFFAMAAAVLVTLTSAKLAARLSRVLRDKIFKKVMDFTNSEFDRFSTASLITRSTNDIQQIQMFMTMMFRIVVYAPLLGIGGIIKVLGTNVSMTWTIALGVAAIMCVIFILFKVAMPKFKSLQKLIDRLNLVTREILTGLSVIRAFSTEKHEEERFDTANKNLMKTNLFVNRAMTFMMPAMMLIMNGMTVLIVYAGAGNIDAGKMQVGDLMAFIQYAMQIIMAFLFISMVSIMMPRAQVAAERVNEVLDTDIMIKDPEEPKPFLPEKKGEVEFKEVYFCYPDADEAVLHNISFTAPAGKTTAFIGSTGSGKSTLINLIPRFFDVTRGSILVDGQDIREVKHEDLCDKIGYVPQKGVLFSGTIESNLKYGKEDATEEEVRRAARIAQAADFIEEKEEGYQSPIAQGGSNVSGGQKQRLSIARAVAKDPEIYIFDDSFSALDYKTDVALRAALQKETHGSTTLIVAQRISTILHADQIIVLDEGNIVGKGTHEQLLQTCPVYQQIAKSQLSEEDLKKAKEVSAHE
ncbi:MAG TPA: ABC transporter ATP-binding protein/permease [Candidatus Anaerostipes excrementavium]|uniref:ABC transporter ATP-binding protein/permease n=1 Tax=Candidatus Anaerostipes excrementavium TaxID=2838463 RepID=A0A9D2BAJ5_9FIRM|nr:ABC transporter ATP-binding protein [uncultured Anaerostipes sp.]HIX68337.1 ABC transporter ATP-binding protein/permease [Candidatus Anaerostipes excrementavium]